MRKLGKDINRYKELTNSNFILEPSSVVIFFFRLSELVSKVRFRLLRLVLNIIVVPLYRFFSVFVGISIPRRTKIGSGFVIFHSGAIAINGLVKIGENCTIRQGVTIGNKNKFDDVPVIGDNVDIGAGAVIIGEVKIGNNVSIGANAVVLDDVPDNHVAVGIPARFFIKK